MDFKDEKLNLELLNRFKTFVREKNHENDELKGEDEEFRFENDREEFKHDKFKHEYKYNPIRSLQSEYWEYSFGDPNDKQYYPHQYVNLRLTHEGLSYEDIKEKIKSKEPYNLLASIGGYYTVVGHGYSTYLNFVEYNDIFLGLIDKHQSLGSMILDFLCNYLDYAGFSTTENMKNKFFNKYCKNYKFYIRDMNMSKELEEKYETGRILHENRDFGISDMLGKANKNHRFLIISSQINSWRTDLGFKTFSISTGHFKVIDKISHNGICQITLLHLPTDIWPVFENEDFDFDAMIEDSRRIFLESFNSDTVGELESRKWEKYKSCTPGLDNEGNYISPFYTIHNSNGTLSICPSLDLKSRFITSGKLLEYNYPSLEKNKFPAPKWLVFPELSSGSLGWRMGYGEDYSMNFHKIRINYNRFNELFPEPVNWSLKYLKQFNKYLKNKFSYDGETPYYTIAWNESGSPKYSFENLRERLKDKSYESIDILDEKGEIQWIFEIFDYKLCYDSFRIDSKRFEDMKDAILVSKSNPYFNELNENLKESIWNEVKYTLVLNLLYFRIMSDDSLIKKLMDSENIIIVADYSPTEEDSDYWASDTGETELIGENHFGFALMEIRDEINRLYKNNDKIDWFYTEFLNQISPYDFKPYENDENDDKIKVDFNNKQSPEYKIYEATYANSNLYVRDVNLSKELEEKYEIGDLIQERGFVDMTDKIGQMTTSHRYAILSNHVGDLSQFEDGTNWSLHTAGSNSIFKILDIYKFNGKTQILLLHLIDGFEELFEDDNTIREDCVKMARENFEESFKSEIIEEVNSERWLKRCEFPLGINPEGNLWEIKKDE